MRRMTYFVMALAMVLGLAQCKKEQPVTPQNEGVMITLNVGDNSNVSRANVEPDATSQVTFESGDEIYVAYNGEYVGYLVHNGSNFEGFVTITPVTPSQPLYFYYLGDNHRLDAADSEGKIRGCTATISDQHLYPHLPVISMGKSIDAEGRTVYYEEGMTSFSSRLYNKCSLMKFNVSTLSTADICITGMNNKVTVDFGKVNEHGDGLGSNPTNQGFSYSQDTDGGLIQMAGSSDAERWVIVLPQTELGEGDNGSAYSTDGIYSGKRPPIHAIESNKWYHEGEDIISLTLDQYSSDVVNLAGLTGTGECEVQSGQILIGTLGANVKISIADDATVTLDGVSINADGAWTSGNYAGITCIGSATIILEGTNTVKGFNSTYPGVQAGPDGTTLTIGGSGTLNATGGSDGAAGIGSGMNASCGNITINGGTIIATGGPNGAGIGTGYTNAQGSGDISCGIITITGGTVTAYGGENAAGIGTGQSRHGNQIRRNECGGVNISGGMVTATGGENGAGIGSGYGRGTIYNPISYCGDINITGGTVVATGGSNSAGIGTGNTYTFGNSNCGNITITPGVTSVTATKGTSARDSIGRGKGKGTCGTVMFGDETIYDGSLWIIAPESGSAYGGLSFSITTVTNTDDTWVLQPE